MHILLQLGLFGGWLLGIFGFFTARLALAEVRRLRTTLAESVAPHTLPVQPGSVWSQPIPLGPIAPGQVASTAVGGPAGPVPEVAGFAEPPPPLEPSTRDLEALITTNWGVWLGSAALLFAGIFLVRYAVEQELLGPAARCGFAALLGFLLLGGAEFLHRHEGPPLVGPFRVDQAPSGLAAGGTAILFGAAYGAGPFYGLLPPLLGLAAMAAASLIALASALRYGPLTAATGIAGAFATPALIATQTFCAATPVLVQQTVQREDAALAIILGAQDKDRVLDRDDDGDGPDHQRDAAQHMIRGQRQPGVAEEDLVQRIQRRRADVAKHDACRSDGQRGKATLRCVARRGDGLLRTRCDGGRIRMRACEIHAEGTRRRILTDGDGLTLTCIKKRGLRGWVALSGKRFGPADHNETLGTVQSALIM
jgi:hypothetical protein